MIKIEKEFVYGWEEAIRGMRNPMNSWANSDSTFENGEVKLGENDLSLMRRLSIAGNDHGKFLRTLIVFVDITAPLYWWKEFDTYKVGTVSNSCSTMHKLSSKEFDLDDFSHEHLDREALDALQSLVILLNRYREAYNLNRALERKFWWNMVQLLPSSYNQKRTIQMNYQVLKAMYFARKDHKLDEWKQFCKWAETLPYFSEIIL